MPALTPPRIIRTTLELQAWSDSCRVQAKRVAMVPTMGALHAGHLALVDEATRRADAVVVTLFVNPTQFGPNEDFDAYPRTESSDLEKLSGKDVDVLFAPNAAEMYPDGFATAVTVGGPSAGLETDFRPHFFAGVATIVAKLLLAGRPHVALFGEKDYQQLQVVKRLSRDLNIGTQIVGLPTVREADGLALSSRNAYLDADERLRAVVLPDTMKKVIADLRAGTDPDAALARGLDGLKAAGFVPDYLVLRDAETLGPADPARPRRILAAAKLGTTRLIDNMAV